MNLWARVLGELCKPQGNALRKMPGWQVWARQLQNKELIMATAGDDYSKISRRNAVAAQLYQSEPEDVKRTIEAIATAEHETALETYHDAMGVCHHLNLMIRPCKSHPFKNL